MNFDAHNIIFQNAVAVLPENIRKVFTPYPELINIAANYPDIFDDPSKPEKEKIKADPEWKKYCIYPDELAGRALHFWPYGINQQHERRSLNQYLLEQMTAAYKSGHIQDFIKFSGCLSHLFGDTTQPAHLGCDLDLKFISQLLPKPNTTMFKDFHYHTDIEAVTGKCGRLTSPKLLGLSALEASWRLAGRNTEAVVYCRRFIVPILQALFAGDTAKAVENASEPLTIAAQLTADSIFTAVKIAEGSFSTEEKEKLNSVDLRLLPADDEFHDLVYGTALLDGSKNVPPANAPVVPAKLKFSDGIRQVKGLGVLPHSGMNRERDCYMSWYLPRGVFKKFCADAGLHSDLAVGGAVSFHILLDGKEVWASGRMTRDDYAENVSLDLGNTETLTLKVCDANEGKTFWKNHAVWADPQLRK